MRWSPDEILAITDYDIILYDIVFVTIWWKYEDCHL